MSSFKDFASRAKAASTSPTAKTTAVALLAVAFAAAVIAYSRDHDGVPVKMGHNHHDAALRLHA